MGQGKVHIQASVLICKHIPCDLWQPLQCCSLKLQVQYSSVIPSLAGAGVDRRYTGDDVVLVVCRLAPLRGPARLRCLRNMLLVIKQC